MSSITLPQKESKSQLERLYVKGLSEQWDPDTSIDWSTNVDYGRSLPNDVGLSGFLKSELGFKGAKFWNEFKWLFQTWLTSQFLHGERAALSGSAKIIPMLECVEAQKVAAVQVMDEARHVHVFERYLKDHIPANGFVITPTFKNIIDYSLSHSSWDYTLLGLQVLIEGIAASSFRLAEVSLHDELIKSIVRLVHRDELRHISFGILNLKEFYSQLTESERQERTEFLSYSAEVILKKFLLEEIWERMEVERDVGVKIALSDELMTSYRRMIFTKVIYAIKRIGLMSKKLQEDLQKIGVITRGA